MRYFVTNGKEWLQEFITDSGRPFLTDCQQNARSYHYLDIAKTACDNTNARFRGKEFYVIDDNNNKI